MAPAGPDKMFSGGLPFEIPMLGTGKLWARNITSDPETGIGKWTEDQILTTIMTMVKPDGTMIDGPMQFMQGPWSQLSDDDLHAVAAYIKSLPPVKNKVPDSTFKPNAGPPAGGAARGCSGPDRWCSAGRPGGLEAGLDRQQRSAAHEQPATTVMKTFGNVAGHTGQARNSAFALEGLDRRRSRGHEDLRQRSRTHRTGP